MRERTLKQLRRKAAVVLVSLTMMLGLTSPAIAAIDPPPATWAPECPPTVSCTVVPAAYTANNGNVGDYGNYDITDRPSQMAIDRIVIHDIEGSADDAIARFKDPTQYVSAHYVIRLDGRVVQMVQTKNMGWHASNWDMNMRSIGFEFEGHAAKGDYTFAQYRAGAELAKYLGRKYNFPTDRKHIVGHDNVTAAPNVLETPASVLKDQHTDPGPFWNWMLLMALVGSPSLPSDDLNTNFVTVAPIWPLSKLPVTGCNPGNQPSCVEPGLRPTNFVYLRTEAREDAPMITDPALGQGSTEVANNAARVFYGQTFALAERPKVDSRGVWYKIFVQGTTGWFFSPWTAPTGLPVNDSKVKSITIAPEKANVPTYARPLPEPGEFPAELMQCPTPPKASPSCWIPTQAPLPYTLPAGHKYVVVDANPTTQHFYAWASDESYPYDHKRFTGATKYVEIQLGNRTVHVKRGDVLMN